ncbi:ABC transporter permease [Streptomonospora salina]|uniref:ABC transporter permease n=1 Tax=Streptomonospora salina TaxID=104205 RepID=UPI0035E8F2E1
MLRTTLAGLRLHKGRLVTTALAVALGVMFVSGTLVFSDTLRESFASQVMGSAGKMDAVAMAEERGPEGEIARDVLAEVRDLPEIDRAAGVTRAAAPLLDPDGRAVGTTPTLGLSVGEVTRYSAAEGDLPEGPEEAALATTTADNAGYEVGDTAQVLDADGEKHSFTVTGLIDFGISDEISYRGAVAFAPATAAQMTGTDGLAEIDAIAAEGVSAQEAADAVEAVAGDHAEVLTGKKLGERLASDAGTQADVLAMGLLLFALISVVVAAIVIHNTFAILVAQRQREMALLRCVGAVRRQVFTSVVAEALVVGVLASAVGVLAGIGLGVAGYAVGSDAIAADASGATAVVTPQTVLIGLAVGTATTLSAALMPARRATFVPPLAALRTSDVASGLAKNFGVVRIAVGTLLLAAAAGTVALALSIDDSDQALMLVAGGGVVAFAGVVAWSPLVVRVAVAAVAPLMRALGVSSALAADNERRNPKRAATAMIALTVGATLITGYAVVNASMMSTTDARLDEQFPMDYRIHAQIALEEDSTGVDPEVARDLREQPEIDTVVAERRKIRESPDHFAYFTTFLGADVADAVDAEAASGDLADVGPGTVAVHDEFASEGVGDTLRLDTEDGERSYEVAAVVDEAQTAWSVIMAPADFAEAFPSVGTDNSLRVTATDGADSERLHDAVYSAVEGHPTLQVQSVADSRRQYEEMLNTAFLAIVAMLGLAVVIAVFGIANTLALSVLERTRESAMLRALGLKRAQLRVMLVWEAVLLCVIGAAVGVGLGAVFGWASVAVMFDDPLFSLPVGQIGAFLAAAVAAGLLASVLPSRQAARTSITAAMASE